MDIMLGNWAEKNINNLDKLELEHFQALLDLENPDLFKWLTGQETVPNSVGNPLLEKLCAELASEMAPKVSVASKSKFEGKVWE